jgi:hypothetical protein
MLRAVAACLIAASLPASAIAEPIDLLVPPPTTTGYRLQIIAADAAALALAAGASRAERGSEGADTLVLSSIATYVAAAPLVHVAHARQGRAAASLALRVGSLFAGALVGGALLPAARCDCSLGPILGAIGGGLAASIIDTTLLAGADKPKRAARWRPTIGSTPRTLSIGPRALAVGVRSAF